MKIKKTAMLLSAIIAITTIISGCNIKTGTNSSDTSQTESGTTTSTTATTEPPIDVPPMTDVDFSTVVAKSTVDPSFDITYGDFYKEYMFYLKRQGITDDTTAENAQTCMDKRQSIVQYLMNERILLKVAADGGFDELTQEELDELQTAYDENLATWYKSFETEATEADASLSGTALEDKCKELFNKMLADCNLTEDDLLIWDRNAKIINKLYDDTTKDIVVDRQEAIDYVEDIVTQAKEAFAKSPTEYEATSYYTSVYIPEGSRYIKHILLQFDEETTNAIISARSTDTAKADELRKDGLAKLKSQADEVMAKLEAGENYDDLLETYSADTAMLAYYPDGYLVVPGSTRFVNEFTDGSFSLEKIGDYKLIESDYGYHILQYSKDAVISEEEYNSAVDAIVEAIQEDEKNKALTTAFAEWIKPYDYDIDYDIVRVIIEETAEEAADTEAEVTDAADVTESAPADTSAQ